LEISEEEREKLTMIARRPKSSGQAMAMRARIVLNCEKSSNSEVARQMKVTGATVGKCGSGLSNHAWTGFWMNRAAAHHAR